MRGTRIEIKKNNIWVPLLLKEADKPKYNALINSIGTINKREISHTDTFELPYVSQNIKALDLNIYNKGELAKSLNRKYYANYFVEDRIMKSGFLVINLTEDSSIKVNFIDQSLEIIERWGSMSYFDLLNSNTIQLPEAYRSFVSSLRSYNIAKFQSLVPVGIIPIKGFHLLRFPNTLNAVGDKFQKTFEGIRKDDAFNPFQSRPIFNVKAFLDIIITSFGYVPEYDNSIDWENIEKTYIIEKDLSGTANDNLSTFGVLGSTIDKNEYYQEKLINGVTFYSSLFVYPSEIDAIYTIDIYENSNLVDLVNAGWTETNKNYRVLDRCIIAPSNQGNYVGTMNWKGRISSAINAQFPPEIKIIWQSLDEEIITQIIPLSDSNILDNSDYQVGTLNITLNKNIFTSLPSNARYLIGVVCSATSSNLIQKSVLFDMVYSEISQKVSVNYDDNDQYIDTVVNLTHAAPKANIKEILSGILKKEGILISFEKEGNQQKVKLFSYGAYSTRKEEGNFRDWSKYFQSFDPIVFNSDYGNDFGKINEVGLSSAFKGNTFKVALINQGSNSKYKDYAENFVDLFKDVQAVDYIDNTVNKYFEYLNEGLGLVEDSGAKTGTMAQYYVDKLASGNKNPVTGNISQIPIISNVNYTKLPLGWIDWYSIVDKSVKCIATFLLPIDEIKNLKLSHPIYVEGLGGFYIIEKVEEYVDSVTPVKVKLIKLSISQNFKFANSSGDFSSDYSNDYSK